jgi:hypothetical protein
MHPKFYPATWTAALSTILAAVVAFGGLSQHTSATILTVATAVLGIVTVAMTRPFAPAALGTVVTTLLTAIAGFGVHLSSAQIGAVVAVVSLVAGMFTHLAASPVAGSPEAVTKPLR